MKVCSTPLLNVHIYVMKIDRDSAFSFIHVWKNIRIPNDEFIILHGQNLGKR